MNHQGILFKSRSLDTDRKALEHLLESSARVLLKAESVFPFDFFPDEITIDEHKVNVVAHEFFLSGDTHSITIDMIKDIELETGPFFATLRIVPDGFAGHVIEIHYLKKKEALKARKLIQGLMVAKKNGIDPVKIDVAELIEKMGYLGETHLRE